MEAGQLQFYDALSDEATERKRIEPEVHYPTNDSPVIYYTQKAANPNGQSEFGCTNGSNMLRRARTGVAG
jgi:hypothetical protein